MSFWRWSSKCYRVHFKDKFVFKKTSQAAWANSNQFHVCGHWIQSIHSWKHMVSTMMNLLPDIGLCVGPEHQGYLIEMRPANTQKRRILLIDNWSLLSPQVSPSLLPQPLLREKWEWDQSLPVPLWTEGHSHLSDYAKGHSGELKFF